MNTQTTETIKHFAEIAMRHRTMEPAEIATATARAMRLAETVKTPEAGGLEASFDGGHYYTFGKEDGLVCWQLYLDADPEAVRCVRTEQMNPSDPVVIGTVCWAAAQAMGE